MNVPGVRRKIQRWDDVNGMVMEDGGLLETPEGQAEGPSLTNPLSDNPLKNAEMAMEETMIPSMELSIMEPRKTRKKKSVLSRNL